VNAAAERESEDDAVLFAAELSDLEHRLAVPYPARAELIEEAAADLCAAYHQERARGLPPEEARARSLRRLDLDEEARHALEGLHASALQRALGLVPAAAQPWLRALFSAAPLAAVFVFLVREVPVNRFLRHGGPIVYLVVSFGALGLLLELQRFFIWFVVRDHSADALRRNTPTPLYLAAATVMLGLLGSAVQYHAFLSRWRGDTLALARGLREPLTSIILACSLAVLTVLLHSALSVGLRALRVPERDSRPIV
jgi:hypothetical protein